MQQLGCTIIPWTTVVKDNYSKFSFDKNSLNDYYIPKLSNDLNVLINNNKSFKLKIDARLLNNPMLLKLFNLVNIDKAKIANFFKYSKIQENYLKYCNNLKDNFEISVDELDYQENKLHVFNIFFIIACGLYDKIEKESLQIFNINNNVITLFKKYANILMENINKIIFDIKEKDNTIILHNEEIFGFGKIFNSFYVLYTNLDNDQYKKEKLKFELIDNSVEQNDESNVWEINFKLNKSEVDSNFTKVSDHSNKSKNQMQSYYEKINSNSLEEECKTYIFSKINDLINENQDKIQLIEIFKILFGLNFVIPYVDENYTLKFKSVTKKLNNANSNYQEYGYQEFDCLFKVIGNEDILMNSDNNNLPFIKSLQIEIISDKEFNQIKFDIKLEDGKQFSIKKNALVLVENKLKFPQKKELFLKYITIMIKKLNFVIKLIKNTTKDFYSYKNIQLLLIYDDIICERDELKKYISEEQIKSILNQISFTEKVKFTIEIIYVSQTVNVYNISKSFEEMNKMKNKMNKMEIEIKNLREILEKNGLLKKIKIA